MYLWQLLFSFILIFFTACSSSSGGSSSQAEIPNVEMGKIVFPLIKSDTETRAVKSIDKKFEAQVTFERIDGKYSKDISFNIYIDENNEVTSNGKFLLLNGDYEAGSIVVTRIGSDDRYIAYFDSFSISAGEVFQFQDLEFNIVISKRVDIRNAVFLKLLLDFEELLEEESIQNPVLKSFTLDKNESFDIVENVNSSFYLEENQTAYFEIWDGNYLIASSNRGNSKEKITISEDMTLSFYAKFVEVVFGECNVSETADELNLFFPVPQEVIDELGEDLEAKFESDNGGDETVKVSKEDEKYFFEIPTQPVPAKKVDVLLTISNGDEEISGYANDVNLSESFEFTYEIEKFLKMEYLSYLEILTTPSSGIRINGVYKGNSDENGKKEFWLPKGEYEIEVKNNGGLYGFETVDLGFLDAEFVEVELVPPLKVKNLTFDDEEVTISDSGYFGDISNFSSIYFELQTPVFETNVTFILKAKQLNSKRNAVILIPNLYLTRDGFLYTENATKVHIYGIRSTGKEVRSTKTISDLNLISSSDGVIQFNFDEVANLFDYDLTIQNDTRLFLGISGIPKFKNGRDIYENLLSGFGSEYRNFISNRIEKDRTFGFSGRIVK